MKRLVEALLALCVALLVGCSHTLAVRAPVLVPARVPVRAFPSIWVAGGTLEEESYLLDRLAAHLAKDGQHEVRRVDLAELEPARQQGKISSSTVVVLLEVSFKSGVQRTWQDVPMQSCSYYGCSTQYQSYLATMPAVTGEVALTVYEGPTASVLQRDSFVEAVAGDDSELMREQVVELLALELEQAVDVLKIRERLELYRVDELPEVKAALRSIARGKWDEGRASLERAAKALGGRDKRTQARVWYDLGIARWFAPGKDGLSQEAFEAAHRALRWAYKLDAHPAHKQALLELGEARKRHLLLEQQRRATAHNFSLARPAPAAPPVEAEAAPEAVPSPADAPNAAESAPAVTPKSDAPSLTPSSGTPATPAKKPASADKPRTP